MKAIGFVGASHADAPLAQALQLSGAETVIESMADLPQAVDSLVAATMPQRKHAP